MHIHLQFFGEMYVIRLFMKLPDVNSTQLRQQAQKSHNQQISHLQPNANEAKKEFTVWNCWRSLRRELNPGLKRDKLAY